MENDFESLSANDVEGALRRNQELRRQIYVDGDAIIVNVVTEYVVPLSRCNTYEGVLAWAHHLGEKTWMNRRLLRRFIEVALEANRLPFPKN